jgi:hypothetical protein
MNTQERLNRAVLYALRSGCFFPVPEPSGESELSDWIRWGAMRNLHNAMREFFPVTPHEEKV